MQFKTYIFLIQFSIFYYKNNLATPIVGPNVRSALPDEFPYVVSIMKLNNATGIEMIEFHKCTGSLVSKKDILTAEHCLRDTLSAGFKVMAGSYDLTQTSPYYPLFFWTFDNWALFRNITIDSDKNDLALIRLIESVPDTIEIAPIGNLDNSFLWGLDLTIAGFGKLGNNSIPRYLQTVKVKILSKFDCERTIYDLLELVVALQEMHLCSYGDPYAVLNGGDSGGPLLLFGALVGINVSIFPYLDGNITPDQINYHMGLRYYQQFIADCLTGFDT